MTYVFSSLFNPPLFTFRKKFKHYTITDTPLLHFFHNFFHLFLAFFHKKALRTTEEFYGIGGTEGQFLLLFVDALSGQIFLSCGALGHNKFKDPPHAKWKQGVL
jgi:hypothetical protein